MADSMNVELITHTPYPAKVIAMAAKLCYSSKANIGDLRESLTPEVVSKFIEQLMDLGHESPLEHVTFTFGVEGVSRALTHQLVRHRIASYSQQSQRYVQENECDFIFPETIWRNVKKIKVYEDGEEYPVRHSYIAFMQMALSLYKSMIEAGVPKEDARYVLPNACETKIIITMNLRSLLHFFNERCCNRAQWEIQKLANKMLELVKEVEPLLFENAGPKCHKYGYCPEGKMCCGLMPPKEV